MNKDYGIIRLCIKCGIEYRPEYKSIEQRLGRCYECRKKLGIEKYKNFPSFIASIYFKKHRKQHAHNALLSYHRRKKTDPEKLEYWRYRKNIKRLVKMGLCFTSGLASMCKFSVKRWNRHQ